jgi:hypothetical protein
MMSKQERKQMTFFLRPKEALVSYSSSKKIIKDWLVVLKVSIGHFHFFLQFYRNQSNG